MGVRAEMYVVVPDGVDDPATPSGGNVYDRRVCQGLAASGWRVHERRAPGPWPHREVAAERALARVVTEIPDDAVVLVDGLIASAAASVLVPEARRLRLVVLAHMLFPGDAEHAVLCAAAAVVATSRWTRGQLLDRYGLLPERVHVAEPGVDPADPVPGTDEGGRLLCVAAVRPHKGHQELLAALATLVDLSWTCTCVGSPRLDPTFADALRRQAEADGIDARVHFTGPRTGTDLDRVYAAADLLVVPSRAESYGMVVTEALARGLPVVATDVGGLATTLGRTADGRRPGLLVRSNDVDALADALRRWLRDADLRRRLRLAAAERRRTLTDWSTTTEHVARVLHSVRATSARFPGDDRHLVDPPGT